MVKKVVKNMNATTHDILNAVRGDASFNYQDRVPLATQNNFKDIAQAIQSTTATMNEFLDTLVNRIGLVMITSKMYTNPLAFLKKGLLEYGEVVEEVFVNITKAVEFDYNTDKNPFERKNPDVRTAFHRLNNQKQYQVTVSEDMLRTALLSESGISDLVSKIVGTLYTSFEFDEFTETKLLLKEVAEDGFIQEVTIPELDTSNSSAIARIIKEYSNNLTFMSDKYNKDKVHTHTPREDQFLIMTSRFNAMFDVDVLANAFNMSKVEFLGNQLVVDDFLDLVGVEAMIIDRDFLMIFDNLIRTTEQHNPARLYWNYWLTTRQTFSVSPFMNAIMFKVSL